MATTDATARFLCQVLGGDSGEKLVNVSWSITTPMMVEELKALTAGAFNSITVPTGTPELVVIVPPTTNTQTLTLKGITGDTGVALAVADPTVIAFGASPAFGITVGAGSTVNVTLVWL